ncbi:complex I NDUFA9 subunit family protein [Phenylobacterium sp.]|uniref:complex I NDUFA9 subunit family protein n=1 Tax=Phenylobacterium sp. TaxID=1871053 RepID=UPI0019B91C50|nr:complex I NDUFA9 subunit family protein [Phenylobacterium sp.]MBC7167998.1 complex I NDUFA9 subunit family protein [Phenylobacterium sp.]
MQDLVTVFGGSGFVGTQVVRALARAGLRVRVAVRRTNVAEGLRLLGDVGQIQIVQANIRNPESVARALEGAQACVNLVGVLYEAGRQKFASLHAMGARNVAEAARAAGVTRLVQMSAIGADAQSESKYARTKAEGEAAVREIFPDAVIIRPSIVFGPEDDFFNRFARMATLSPALPLIGGGKTRFQPVYVGDVAQAIARALRDPACAGQTYELGGPAVLTFRELMELVLEETQRRRFLVPLPFAVARAIGGVGDLIAATPVPPPLTTDQVAQLKRDNVANPDAPGLEALGIRPTAIEAVLPSYLYRYRLGGQFAEPPENNPAAQVDESGRTPA